MRIKHLLIYYPDGNGKVGAMGWIWRLRRWESHHGDLRACRAAVLFHLESNAIKSGTFPSWDTGPRLHASPLFKLCTDLSILFPASVMYLPPDMLLLRSRGWAQLICCSSTRWQACAQCSHTNNVGEGIHSRMQRQISHLGFAWLHAFLIMPWLTTKEDKTVCNFLKKG